MYTDATCWPVTQQNHFYCSEAVIVDQIQIVN